MEFSLSGFTIGDYKTFLRALKSVDYLTVIEIIDRYIVEDLDDVPITQLGKLIEEFKKAVDSERWKDKEWKSREDD